ncbi:MAG: chromate efflux transporter [Flavipsychrobacter sp.]|nr:chromate efflux transporter [Flavipsychrobacter sp.]
MFLRHLPFLRAVTYYAFTAFGGPQGHMGMMIKTFVEKRHDVTEEELLEYNAFCQMMPGPSSTQTVMLIAMKRGGVPLAILSLLLWIMPAVLIMSAFSFLITYIDTRNIQTTVFKYIQPMSVGFVCYAAARMMKNSIKHVATIGIMTGCLLVTLVLHQPWVFPALLVVAGVISNFSDKRIPDPQHKPKKINWMNLWLFGALFLVAGALSLLARTNNWQNAPLFNLFENFYRFGTIVFGGGQALQYLMLLQFVTRPRALGMEPVVTTPELLTGFGIVQAVPGPVFSVCAYAGGLAMHHFGYGVGGQLFGSILATIAVFLPSTLLLFFFFPIYQKLKQHVIIYRALEGINAAIVGIMWASGIILFQTMDFEWTNLVVVAITFAILNFTKIPAPYVVIGWLLLGYTLNK